MMEKADPFWERLEDALGRCSGAGLRPRFWLRDDDAVEPTSALDRLLGLAASFAAPVALAVIPAASTDALASLLDRSEQVQVLIHGWSHENHAGPAEKKQELGSHRPPDRVLGDLERGLATIRGRFADRALPVLVPPWNRIGPALLPGIGGLGYVAVSAFGPALPAALPLVNATVDIIDWRGTRGGRDHSTLIAGIVSQLDAAIAARAAEPIGILSHHLVHDDAAWTFLERLFDATTRNGDCDWLSIGDLIGEMYRGRS